MLSRVLAAVLAETIDLKCVAGGIEVILAANFLFQLAHLGGEELDGNSAAGANHVVMATAVELMFVTGYAVVKSDFAGEPALRQQLERAVDGSKANFRVLFPRQAKELIRGKMIAGFQESTQDGIPLVGMFQAHAFEVFIKNVLGFAHGFARRRRMIVNPSLQHNGNAETKLLRLRLN
jgi:hypothetical protein